MSQTEDISSAEVLASVISGNGRHNSTALVRPVHYRAPVYLLSVVDAMAAQAGKSRNSMLNMLLGVGVEEVRKQLSQETAESLLAHEAAALASLLDGETETLSE